jgi:hypothetical protein
VICENAVGCFVDSSQENWDEHLPQLAGAMRSCINRSTGFTPNMLMLGCETNQPADLMFGVGKEQIYSGSDEYVMGLDKAWELSTKHPTAFIKLLFCLST